MKTGKSLLTKEQLELDLQIEKEVEIDGVGMGVLSDGTPYLTGRGLARMCGIDQKSVVQMTAVWDDPDPKPREAKIKEILRAQGFEGAPPFIRLTVDGVPHHAFPDHICMAVLEYYAFEAGPNMKAHALKNYRLLARKSFREFIYAKVGYDPRAALPRIWRQFHDRVSLVFDSVPTGYFSVFKEIADIMVTLIRSGAAVGSSFIPDISVGNCWGKFWRENDYDVKYGARRTYDHNYPEYFPQAASNPQAAYCYPDEALPEFRRWIREEYLPSRFPDYLKNKEKEGKLPPAFRQAALKAIAERGKTARLGRP